MPVFPFCLAVFALIGSSHSVSTKLGFGDEDSTITKNSTNVEDEDVEVQHTIVLSTKLKNNNRRGIHGTNDDRGGALTYNIGRRENAPNEDSGEVPIMNGYKAVETTQIRTPDTRQKPPFPDATFMAPNLRDAHDIYPNLATPMQWKPSNYFNNINKRNQEYFSHGRSNNPYYQNKIQRRIADDSVKEFNCRRCLELSNGQGIKCGQRTPWYGTTTPKARLDGKLAKLN